MAVWGHLAGGYNRKSYQALYCSTGASHASYLGGFGSRVSYVKKRQVWKSRSETDWPHLRTMPGFSTAKNCSILMLTSTCWQEISLSNTIELTTVTPWKQKICHYKRRFLPVFENRVRRQSGFPTFISCQRHDVNVLPKRRQWHQGDKLCDVSTVPLVAHWPVFLARGSNADGEPHSTGSIVCLCPANFVMCHDWAVLFLCTSPFQCDSQQTYVKTKPPNQGASRDLLRVGRQWNLWNFRKPAKNDV